MRVLPSVTVVVVLSGLTSCSDPARPHLERLAEEWGDVVATGYVHSETYSEDEWHIHYIHEQNRVTNRMLTEFLDDDPPVSDELKALLRSWKTVTAEIEAIHEKMIDEKRFTYKENERVRAQALVRAESKFGLEVAEHMKGY